jgi:1,2-dihydroxy-3-keto-5-methylthiopentene dioxygenase
MAHVRIPEQDRQIDDPGEIAAFLRPFGIHYERWEVEGRIDGDATSDEILAAYAPEIDRLKAQGGYVTADVIDVTPDVPNLDAMINKFNKEHTHDEDEVRFIVKGRGIFHLNLPGAPVFSIETEAGDLINVPAGTRHWFDLCQEKCIRAIRLFLDTSGWTPHYVDGGVHEEFIPVCWGPSYIAPDTPTIEPLQ